MAKGTLPVPTGNMNVSSEGGTQPQDEWMVVRRKNRNGSLLGAQEQTQEFEDPGEPPRTK